MNQNQNEKNLAMNNSSVSKQEQSDLEWDAFLENISGSEKKNLWKDLKKENKTRVVFVEIGKFVKLFHNYDALFRSRYGFCTMGGDMVHTGFVSTELEKWKLKLKEDGYTFCVI